jgi:non-canonical (house-cleaning) NTP pyrophosphatase
MTEAELVIALGTTRAPKVRAVRRALFEIRDRFPRFLEGEIRLEPRSVPSGVAETPRSTTEAMRGAQSRAEGARRQVVSEGLSPVLAIGLEGGVASENGLAFLHSWAYVTDGARGHFGSGGSVPLPAELVRAVMEEGEELGGAADRYFERREVAAHEGTFGVLTGMMVSREEAFARSLIHALAPFYNARAYGGSSQGET